MGDTVVVDIPFPDNAQRQPVKYDGINNAVNYGFLVMQKKRGVPVDKITLVVRALPSDPTLRKSFARRGQILGTCVTAGLKGKRIDIVHTSSAIGLVNTIDMYS